MKGDFSRLTFDPYRHFSRILLQQGRISIDADWNEQMAILVHSLRTAIADFAGPVAPIGQGFLLTHRVGNDGNPLQDDFLIGPGHLYVDGILCENDSEGGTPYSEQPHSPCPPGLDLASPVLAYLDVWERHITHLQDDRIREVALGGPDTATRARVVWQVKLAPLSDRNYPNDWEELVRGWQPTGRGVLKVRTDGGTAPDQTDPLLVSPGGYQGLENRLYRIEIHRSGPAAKATYKWSRQNGAVALPIRTLENESAQLTTLGVPGNPLALPVGTWVEVEDDDLVLDSAGGVLGQVLSVDSGERSLGLEVPNGVALPQFQESAPTHPILRRWDHTHGIENGAEEADDGALTIEEDRWIALDDGIEILFETGSHTYRRGDYWLIPARTETRDVEWPQVDDQPMAQRPHGVEHHYAPLAVITSSPTEGLQFDDCLAETRR